MSLGKFKPPFDLKERMKKTLDPDRGLSTGARKLSATIGALSKTILCPICRETFSEPQSLRCNHVFCRTCILESLESRFECPICRVPGKPRDLSKARFVEQLLEELTDLEQHFNLVRDELRSPVPLLHRSPPQNDLILDKNNNNGPNIPQQNINSSSPQSLPETTSPHDFHSDFPANPNLMMPSPIPHEMNPSNSVQSDLTSNFALHSISEKKHGSLMTTSDSSTESPSDSHEQSEKDLLHERKSPRILKKRGFVKEKHHLDTPGIRAIINYVESLSQEQLDKTFEDDSSSFEPLIDKQGSLSPNNKSFKSLNPLRKSVLPQNSSPSTASNRVFQTVSGVRVRQPTSKSYQKLQSHNAIHKAHEMDSQTSTWSSFMAAGTLPLNQHDMEEISSFLSQKSSKPQLLSQESIGTLKFLTEEQFVDLNKEQMENKCVSPPPEFAQAMETLDALEQDNPQLEAVNNKETSPLRNKSLLDKKSFKNILPPNDDDFFQVQPTPPEPKLLRDQIQGPFIVNDMKTDIDGYSDDIVELSQLSAPECNVSFAKHFRILVTHCSPNDIALLEKLVDMHENAQVVYSWDSSVTHLITSVVNRSSSSKLFGTEQKRRFFTTAYYLDQSSSVPPSKKLTKPAKIQSPSGLKMFYSPPKHSLFKCIDNSQKVAFPNNTEIPLIDWLNPWLGWPSDSIVGKPKFARRTIKYARAMLEGCWILSSEWIKDCLDAKQFLSEEPYLVFGDISALDSLSRKVDNITTSDRQLNKRIEIHLQVPLTMTLDKPPLYNDLLWDKISWDAIQDRLPSSLLYKNPPKIMYCFSRPIAINIPMRALLLGGGPRRARWFKTFFALQKKPMPRLFQDWDFWLFHSSDPNHSAQTHNKTENNLESPILASATLQRPRRKSKTNAIASISLQSAKTTKQQNSVIKKLQRQHSEKAKAAAQDAKINSTEFDYLTNLITSSGANARSTLESWHDKALDQAYSKRKRLNGNQISPGSMKDPISSWIHDKSYVSQPQKVILIDESYTQHNRHLIPVQLQEAAQDISAPPLVSNKWFLDSISAFAPLPFDLYKIEKGDLGL